MKMKLLPLLAVALFVTCQINTAKSKAVDSRPNKGKDQWRLYAEGEDDWGTDEERDLLMEIYQNSLLEMNETYAPFEDEYVLQLHAPAKRGGLWAGKEADQWQLHAPEALDEVDDERLEEIYQNSLRLDAEDRPDNTTHDDCMQAWAMISQSADTAGCVAPRVLRRFARRCRIPELKQQMIELKSNCSQGNAKHFLSVVTEDERAKVTMTSDNATAHSRSKRMVLSNEQNIWPGAKVPFIDGTSQSNIRAMKTFERFTCIRFYPWSNEGGVTTNTELGLDHQGYLKFVYEGGCWADLGNRRSSGGQKVSCCGGITCLHEVGHALGAYHEHQNPLGKGTIRLNPQNAEDDKVNNFRETSLTNTYTSGFDMQSIMAYGKTTFSNGNGEVISYEFSDIGGGNDWYYLLKEVSTSHKCDELYCSDFSMDCVNDGYLSLVDGVCGCMCPPGLDPATGCSQTLKDTGSSDTIKWPAGQYALPTSSEGCPGNVFSDGSRVETGGVSGDCADKNVRGCPYWFDQFGCDANPGFMHNECPFTCGLCGTFGHHTSTPYHLAGTVNANQVEHKFCSKENTDNDDVDIQWPVGQYCIYRKGGNCPPGFDYGSATFTDAAGSVSNSATGSLPDGEFTGSSTTLRFCCSKYGWTQDELVLPRTEAFALMMSGDEYQCHNVRGMHVYEGYTAIVNSGGSPTLEGHHPVRELDAGKNSYKIPYCYYTPTEKESCSEVIELSASNPTATITGTNGKDFLCNWLVKGPESSRILLNFDSMDVAESGHCVDTVSIRYNRLGQSPQIYCGDRLEKSISTVNNTLRLTYDTYNIGQSSFTATVSLIYEDNLCYSVKDKGQSYAGKVNRTRGLKTCIPWVQAAHCPHSPFKDGDMTDGLQDNYCRNPDTVDGLRPWCYTQAEGCQRDYCDVCLFENLYDVESNANCEILAQNGLCENDPAVQEKCAGTCSDSRFLTSFPQPTLVKGVTCPAPASLPDGDIVGGTKASYAVGDVVTYACKDASTPNTKERRCLSTGEWSSLNLVCTECELGWFHRNGNCYNFVDQSVTQPNAVSACQAMGAQLVMAKTQDEMDFLAGISFWDGSWLAASDAEVEGEWKWSDGTPFDWTRWIPGQPDNYGNEDCLWMSRDGQMEDRWCHTDVTPYICMKPENPVTSCEDVTDDCANFYSNDPNSCTSQSDFMHRNCKKTCGLCGGSGDSQPSQPVDCWEGHSSNYAGTLSVTKSGKTCQRWDSQTPHEHYTYSFPEDFIDEVLPENYCRNAVWEDFQPWCYTTDPDTRFEYCDVEECKDGATNPSNEGPASCPVETPSGHAEMTSESSSLTSVERGGHVTYQCQAGAKYVSGDTVRGCLAGGVLSGEQLQCQVDNSVSTSDEAMEKSGDWGNQMNKDHAYSGNIPGFQIPKDGRITQWQFWSDNLGQTAFQVWRPTSDERLEFVGQNLVSTPAGLTSTFYVPEADQIAVQQGDMIGVYYPDSSAAVGYTRCDPQHNPGSENLRIISNKVENSDFGVGLWYDFKADTNDVCRIYRFKAIVE